MISSSLTRRITSSCLRQKIDLFNHRPGPANQVGEQWQIGTAVIAFDLARAVSAASPLTSFATGHLNAFDHAREQQSAAGQFGDQDVLVHGALPMADRAHAVER